MAGSSELSGSKYLLFLAVDLTGLPDREAFDLTLLISFEADNLAEARRFGAGPGASAPGDDAGAARDDRRGIVVRIPPWDVVGDCL